jgi:hypothetical protein
MRQEFSKATKAAAFERANGMCECGCQMPLVGRPEYDHNQEDFIGGNNSLENCRCVNKKCHDRKSKKNRPAIDKTRRIIEKAAGLRTSGRSFQTNRNGKYKMKMNGTVERR